MEMKNRGFLLIQVLIGLFILSIVAVTSLSILNTIIYNLKKSKTNMEMVYMAESIIEEIKTLNHREEGGNFLLPYDLITSLKDQGDVQITFPSLDNNQYSYEIFKREIDDLWEIRVRIIYHGGGRDINNVEITSLLPRPN